MTSFEYLSGKISSSDVIQKLFVGAYTLLAESAHRPNFACASSPVA